MIDQPSPRQSLPASDDAERGLLCSMLRDERACLEALALPGLAKVFYNPAHQQILASIIRLTKNGVPRGDFFLYKKDLADVGMLEEIGGAEYLNTVWTFIPTSANWLYYFETCRDMHIRRTAILFARKLEADMFDSMSGGGAEILIAEEVEQVISEFGQQQFQAKELWHEKVDAVAKSIREPAEQKKDLIHFGIEDLDAELSGLESGDMCVIGGQTSRGKTSLALNLARHTAEAGHFVAIFSAEMSVERVVRRLLSDKSNISVAEFKRGLKGPFEVERFERARKCVRELPIYASHPNNIAELVNQCRALKARHDLRLVVVDYLQILQSDSPHARNWTREAEVSGMSRRLKNMATDLGVVVVVLSQLNDDGQLRESRAIGMDADTILILDDPSKGGQQSFERTISIDKQRDGRWGRKVPVKFLGNVMRFESAHATGPTY